VGPDAAEQRGWGAGLVAAAGHRANFKIPVDLVFDLLEFAEITQSVEVLSQAGEMTGGTESLQRPDGYVRSNRILFDRAHR